MLRTRLTALMVLVLALLWAMSFVVLWQQNQRFETRYAESLQLSQGLAWNKIQSRALSLLKDYAKSLLGKRSLAESLYLQDRASVAKILDAYTAEHPGLRVDAYGPARSLVYTSSMDLNQRNLVDAARLKNMRESTEPLIGMSQSDAEHYHLLAIQPVGSDPSKLAVVALAFSINEALEELRQSLGYDAAYVLNLRGRMTHGTDTALWKQLNVTLPAREPSTKSFSLLEKNYRAVGIPIRSPENRVIGTLVTVRDMTKEAKEERFSRIAWGSLAVLVPSLVTWAFFSYVRRQLRPLGRAVGVLGALAKGDTSARLAETDEELSGEAGDIARGVVMLREEVLNLEMLREERRRQSRRQEALLREKVYALAVNLEADVREQITGDLDHALNAAGVDGNQLSILAEVLGRLSSLINAQQEKLLQYVVELQAAVVTKARLAGLQQELQIAREMQLSILPGPLPAREEVAVYATMIPAKEVGGDFYDYFYLDDKHLGIAVADVSGKGPGPAFFMGISRTLLKANAPFLRAPGECLRRVNDLLAAQNDKGMFVTTFYGVLNLVTGMFVYANAGHNPPLMGHRDGRVEWLPQTGGIALAVMEDMDFAEAELQLAPGDSLLFYTDGVTEANNQSMEMFGENRLLDEFRKLRAGPAEMIPSAIFKIVEAFADGAPQADDITVVVLRYAGASKSMGAG